MRIVTTADGSKSLFSERFSEAYHSERGALTESRMLFLDSSGIASRLAAGEATNAVELGFGTGLNFFLAADVALETGTPLTFTSFEMDLPPAALVRQLGYENALPNAEVLSAYLAWRSELHAGPGVHTFTYEHVTLVLVLGNMVHTIPVYTFPVVHAVLLDAFSPRTNPEPWQASVLGPVMAALAPGAHVVTFTVAGAVRRTLLEFGLTIQKLPGPPGGKKEVLRGVKA